MHNKKKILIVFPHSPNPRMIKRVRALLTKYEVHVIYWDRGLDYKKKNELPSGSKVTVIEKKANEGEPLKRLGVTISVIKEVVSLAKKKSPDILYLSKTDMLFSGVIYKKMFGRDCKIIYEVSDLHTLLIDVQKRTYKKFISKILNIIEKSLCKTISLLIVTSEYFYDKFYKKIVPQNRVVFMPNTPDPSIFEGFNRKPCRKFTVGFIGAVRYAEQLEMLINASAEANINVLIAGGGKDYQRIKDYAKKFKDVEVYGEYVYEEEIRELYERVDCIYSVYDTKLKNVQIALPNRLYEAALTATPIIASKDTYLGQLVDEYGLGKTVSPNSKSELVEVILQLKEESNHLNNIEDRAKSFAKKWDLKKFNRRLLNAIENILEEDINAI